MREPVELGMDAGAVQALVVVLGDRLPVGLDVVDDLRAALQLAGAVAGQQRGEVADVLGRRRRLAGEVEQDEPVDDREADRASGRSSALSKSSMSSVNGALLSEPSKP